MKSFVALTLVVTGLAAGAVEPQSLKSFATVPPQVKLHFANFCLGQYPALFADNEKGFASLASTPGLTPALMELANRFESEQEWDGFTRAWGLIAQRTDATAGEQSFVRNKLDELFNRNADPGGSAFKLSGLSFLGLYPSNEHEQFLIRYLSDTNGDRGGDPTDVAAESLGKIGTAASIESLRAYADKHKPPPGGKSRYYDTAVAALDQINARIEAASRSTTPSASNAAQQQRPSKSGKTQAEPPSEEPASSTPWSIIVVLIVAVTGLLWLLVKKRK